MGKFFSLSGDSKDTPETPQVEQPPSGSVQDSIRADAAAAVERDLAAPTRRRRRSASSDARAGEDDQRVLQAKINAAITAQLDALHDPKAWEALLCIPADAALTLTGHERWKLNERERETLGVTGSAAARTMMITNPRALAFFMLGSAMFSVYVPRAIGQLKEMRDKAAKKGKPDENKPAA